MGSAGWRCRKPEGSRHVVARWPWGCDQQWRQQWRQQRQRKRQEQQKEELARTEPEGTAVAVFPDGFLATNSHVLGSAKFIDIRLEDGRLIQASIIGRDPFTDIALLKVPLELPILKLAQKIKTVKRIKSKVKQLKHQNGVKAAADEDIDSDIMFLLLLILAIILPPATVYLIKGRDSFSFKLNLVLWLIGFLGLGLAAITTINIVWLAYVLAIVHALLVLFGNS